MNNHITLYTLRKCILFLNSKNIGRLQSFLNRLSFTVLVNKTYFCVTWRVFEDVNGKKERKRGWRKLQLVNHTNFFDSEIYCSIFYSMNFWAIKIQHDDLCKSHYHSSLDSFTHPNDYSALVIVHIQV